MNAENQDERVALTVVGAVVSTLLIATVIYVIRFAGGPAAPAPAATTQAAPATQRALALGTVTLTGTPARITIGGTVPDEATHERLLKPARVLWGRDNVVDEVKVEPNAAPLWWRARPVDVLARLKQLASFELRTDKNRLQLAGTAPNEAVRTVTRDGATGWFIENPNATVTLGVLETAQAGTPSDSFLDERIEFATSESAIPPASKARLDDIASLLKDDDRVILITGHTDNQGGEETNGPLSVARAESVRVYLISQGVPDARLVAKGAGATQPVADNSTDEGRQRNRRIAFSVQAR